MAVNWSDLELPRTDSGPNNNLRVVWVQVPVLHGPNISGQACPIVARAAPSDSLLKAWHLLKPKWMRPDPFEGLCTKDKLNFFESRSENIWTMITFDLHIASLWNKMIMGPIHPMEPAKKHNTWLAVLLGPLSLRNPELGCGFASHLNQPLEMKHW